MTPDTDVLLDGVRTLLFRVWSAVNRKASIPKLALADCFRSFGLEIPFCDIHRRTPDAVILLTSLETLEASMMGVDPW